MECTRGIGGWEEGEGDGPIMTCIEDGDEPTKGGDSGWGGGRVGENTEIIYSLMRATN
jgi:hypothetical protein